PFRVVNIGGGQPVSLMDFVETVEKALGRPAIRKMLAMQKGDVPRTFAAPDLLVALTGYKPGTTLDVGVKAFVEWFLEVHQELNRI
ncbi:UDP-glucuronate 5-epimerase, partial [Rhizobium lentis]|nr:UDP-glucuronate 5-epimerase [Rhizobium lentis]